jgi:CRISPR-associated endonuclease Csn1
MSKISRPLYRLALDLGMTSLGWTIFRLIRRADGRLEPVAIIRAGVRLFNSGRDLKTEASLAVKRREARAMRRRRDRLLKRKARMMEKLIQYGFFPQEKETRKALEKCDPYELRARGLSTALQPGEFARALFHLNQRRGFKSNRKTDKNEKDSSALKAAISRTRQELKDRNCATVGQWLWQRVQNGESVRARYRENRIVTPEGKNKIDKSYDLYIDRAMIEAEFDQLWKVQSRFNPELFNEAARKDLKETLLHQRPLRPVKPGRCTLLSEEERAPLAMPSQQRFRIYQEVNNLRCLSDDLREETLTLEARDKIVAELEKKKELTFNAIRELLQLPGHVSFNLEDEKRDCLKGNTTSALLSKNDFFGKAWHKFNLRQQDEIVIKLLTEESESVLVDWLKKETGIDEIRAKSIANKSLPNGYGNLSRKALDSILPHLQGSVITYDKAVQAAGFSHHSDLGFDFEHSEDEVDKIEERVIPSTGEIKSVFAFRQLPYYGKALQRHVGFGSGKQEDGDEKRYGKIANPTVHIGLNQVRIVVNALIRRYGRPAEVVIEVARELKQNREQRLEQQKQQAENQKRNARIRTAIAEIRQGISEEQVKREDIQKWILWEELNPKDCTDRRCPYSGMQISGAMLFSGQVEIEHILPFSKTLDDSLNNKTVATREANRVKRNHTPWEAKVDFERKGWSYEGILLRAEKMSKNKRYRFGEEGYQRWLKEDQDFLARSLNDTRHLSRVAAEYLRLVCPGANTCVIPGKMTALLRAKLGLNDILGLEGKKNRNDHRHHAVDACVIGITDRGMLKKFAEASADARQKQLDRLVEHMPLPWETYYDHVKRAVENVHVSHKPDHGYEGELFDATVYNASGNSRIASKTRTVTPFFARRNQADAIKRHMGKCSEEQPYKGLLSNNNYCIEITRDENGAWRGETIQTFRAYAIILSEEKRLRNEIKDNSLKMPNIIRKQAEARLRHPGLAQNGQSLVMRLMIDDYICAEINGKSLLLKVQKISSSGSITFIRPNEANIPQRYKAQLDARKKLQSLGIKNLSREEKSTLQDVFFQRAFSAESLKEIKARRVTISPIGELRDPGFKG